MKLNKQDITNYEKALEKSEGLAATISDRVDEIIDLIHRIFDVSIQTPRVDGRPNWWFNDAPENSQGTIDLNGFDMAYTLEEWVALDSGSWSYGSSFPYAFLTMTDEQITDWIEAELKKTEEKKKKAADRRVKKKKSVKAVALKKLTMEERKALGV